MDGDASLWKLRDSLEWTQQPSAENGALHQQAKDENEEDAEVTD